LTNVTQTK